MNCSRHTLFVRFHSLFFHPIPGAGKSGGRAGAKGQGAVLEGPGGWSEEHHDPECGPDPGPRRETGRPHGQVGGPASRGQSCPFTVCEL